MASVDWGPCVRAACAEDAEAIAAIWNHWIEHSAATFTTELRQPKALADMIDARGPGFQIVERAGTVEGFATFFQFRGGPGYRHTYEHTIQLAPDARGGGAGRALMIALEREAQAAGVHSLIAGVSGENPAGAAFHARLGYTEIARLPEVGFKFGRWMDLVLMQKIFAAPR